MCVKCVYLDKCSHFTSELCIIEYKTKQLKEANKIAPKIVLQFRPNTILVSMPNPPPNKNDDPIKMINNTL